MTTRSISWDIHCGVLWTILNGIVDIRKLQNLNTKLLNILSEKRGILINFHDGIYLFLFYFFINQSYLRVRMQKAVYLPVKCTRKITINLVDKYVGPKHLNIF